MSSTHAFPTRHMRQKMVYSPGPPYPPRPFVLRALAARACRRPLVLKAIARRPRTRRFHLRTAWLPIQTAFWQRVHHFGVGGQRQYPAAKRRTACRQLPRDSCPIAKSLQDRHQGSEPTRGCIETRADFRLQPAIPENLNSAGALCLLTGNPPRSFTAQSTLMDLQLRSCGACPPRTASDPRPPRAPRGRCSPAASGARSGYAGRGTHAGDR